MNIPLLVGGLFGSFFFIMFIVIAVIDGMRMAFAVLGTVLGMFLAITALGLFWIWVAGGFA